MPWKEIRSFEEIPKDKWTYRVFNLETLNTKVIPDEGRDYYICGFRSSDTVCDLLLLPSVLLEHDRKWWQKYDKNNDNPLERISSPNTLLKHLQNIATDPLKLDTELVYQRVRKHECDRYAPQVFCDGQYIPAPLSLKQLLQENIEVLKEYIEWEKKHPIEW